MNELRIKRLLIVSVILNVILIFLFVQALSGNINPKKDVERDTSNVPIISPLCKLKKGEDTYKSYDDYLEHLTPEKLREDWNDTACYWVNPITKRYFKFDENITLIKESTDRGDDYYKFEYFNTPLMNLIYAPAFTSNDSMDDFKGYTMSVFKVRLITKGDYVKRGTLEKWTGSGFEVNKDGSDGDFVVLVLVKKDNKFWLIYGYYNSRYKYNDKITMKLIDDIIETL
ncbi:hypothetical protein LM997_001332 [Salmonella enterica]|nr:hypothetical protein [Salmonella enterica]EIJ8269973.1 hypothetical protein [Salmonella enterica]EIM4714199.1 hypothetical protein [Salmonella enterica]